MKDLSSEQPALSLSQLNSIIKSAVADTLPGQYWVVAEIADIKLHQKGHCYLELVEKEDSSLIAQIRGTIWAYEYRSISSRFHKVTNEQLRRGMKILFLASISFHEVYGLSLSIRDIDPTFTMGEMARKKKEVIDRLRKEGIIDRNRMLELPLVPQRVAVISSRTAAGYEDFFSHLDKNPHGYRYVHRLFPALMQGPEAEVSIIRALTDIAGVSNDYDVVVIIRGGGSVIDLNCFDSYPLASCIARFPLPVITGIGHEKDDTVVDIVAHTKMKTPTAVAEFLISGARSFEDAVVTLETLIIRSTKQLLQDEGQRLTDLTQRLSIVPVRLVALQRHRLLLASNDVFHHAKQIFLKEQNRISTMGQALRHLDPLRVLSRGYSITRHRGKIVRDAQTLKGGMTIETLLQHGKLSSIVQPEREAYHHGKEQDIDLLPGFE